MSTILNGRMIKKSMRWSDHPGKTRIKRGRNPQKKNKPKKIEQEIKELVYAVERIRLRILLDK